jgi:hypothetical protein
VVSGGLAERLEEKLPAQDVLLEGRVLTQRRLLRLAHHLVMLVPSPALAKQQLSERVQVLFRVLASQVEERTLLQAHQIVAGHWDIYPKI